MNNGIFARICSFAASCCLLLFTTIDARSEVRTWTSKFGARSIQGEFVELKDDKLTLSKPDGSTITLPLSALITEDQDVAKQIQSGADLKNRVDVIAALKGRMIRMEEGKAVPYELSKEKPPSHFLFYVVSSLCDTCLDHAPRLKAYYEETLAPAPEIELVVISLDTDKEQQREYLAAQRLPFPAVDFEAMAPFSADITSRVFSSKTDGCQTFILTSAEGKVLGKSALEPKKAIAAVLKE